MQAKPLLTILVAALPFGVIACTETTSPTTPLRADLVAAPTPTYAITDLGTLGGESGEARAINNAGAVVGSSATAAGETHAFFWTARDGMTDLGTLGGSTSGAYAVNDRGHVVGVSEDASGEERPFFWTASGGMQDLGTFGGGFGEALGINDHDQVVGSSTLPDGSIHAFLWTPTGGLVDLASVIGDNSQTYAITNRQQMVGGFNFSTAANDFCAFTIPFLSDLHGDLRNLGELQSPDSDPCGGAFATAMNDNGVVVGFAENEAFLPRAFRWTAATGMVDLGTLIGPDGFATARGVNARGQIVGLSSAVVTAPNAGGLTIDAALWDENGVHDLGSLPGDLGSRAFGINDRSQIVGRSTSFSLVNRAVLWTPENLTP